MKAVQRVISGQTSTHTMQVVKTCFCRRLFECFERSFARSYDWSCEWTKGPARHKETWQWNDDVSKSVSKKQKLWEEWKQGKTIKEQYLEPKKKTRRTVHQAKCETERKRFGNIMGQDDQNCCV